MTISANHLALLDQITAPPSVLDVLAPSVAPMERRAPQPLADRLLEKVRNEATEISEALYTLAMSLEEEEPGICRQLTSLSRDLDKMASEAQDVAEWIQVAVDAVNDRP